MNINQISEIISKKISFEKIEEKKPPFAGSKKIFFKLFIDKQNILFGMYEPEYKFFDNCKKLYQKAEILGNPFPELKYFFDEEQILITDYLGEEHLFDSELIEEYIYPKLIDKLVKFQEQSVINIKHFDFLPEFNYSDFIWETNYFKEYVLEKYLNKEVDNTLWMNDTRKIADICDSVRKNCLMHRDFQSKNIMIKGVDFYFIDNQSMKIGTNYYDLASLLYDPYKDFEEDFIDHQIKEYVTRIKKTNILHFDRNIFNYFVLQRLMQASAAYIKLGIFDKKDWFFKYFKPAINKIKLVLLKIDGIEYLKDIVYEINEGE